MHIVVRRFRVLIVAVPALLLLAACGGGGYGGGDAPRAPNPGVLSISVASGTVDEGAAVAQFTIERSGGGL